jgi:hypothetical protein
MTQTNPKLRWCIKLLTQVLHSEFQENWLGTSGTVTMEQHISKQQTDYQTDLQIKTKTYT